MKEQKIYFKNFQENVGRQKQAESVQATEHQTNK
jgi:hypothetical protein